MDREFSKDISAYKRKAAKGFSRTELLFGMLILAVGTIQIYFFTSLGIHMLIATYLAMPLTIVIGFLCFFKKKEYTLFGLLLKKRELKKTSGAMPYRSEEELKILTLTTELQRKGGRYDKKKERK